MFAAIDTIKMKAILFYILIILLFSYSCKKEEYRKPVIAGIYDSTFDLHEFSPPLKVNLKLDTLNNFYVGADSIDINLDGKFDLIIKQRLYLDIKPPINYTYYNYPFCSLKCKNGLECSEKFESYYQGQGSIGGATGIDALSYYNRIDNISNWSGIITDTLNTSIKAMWTDTHSLYSITNGYWFYLTNTEKYIGIRMKINSQYKYGWIRVNEISRENISFISYAFEK